MSKQYLDNKSQTSPKVTLSEHKGVLYMHLGTDWIQGAMRIARPNEIVIDYVQNMMIWMLFNDKPKHIVQLGLGSAALTKFCYHHFKETNVTAIEINPAVIDFCHNMFHLPPDDERLHVIQMDANEFIRAPKTKNTIDVLQIDLYDDQAQAPLFDTPEFYQACAKALTDNGIMTMNVFGLQSDRAKTLSAIEESFDAVIDLPEVDGGNMVVLAFKTSPEVLFEDLDTRARHIRTQTKLKSEQWVDDLREWMVVE